MTISPENIVKAWEENKKIVIKGTAKEVSELLSQAAKIVKNN